MKIKDGINTINVSENSHWKSLIGKTITSIDTYWDESERIDYLMQDTVFIYGITRACGSSKILPGVL